VAGSRDRKRRPAFVLFLGVILLSSIRAGAWANDPAETIHRMVNNGFDEDLALRLFADWKNTKGILIGFAKSGDPKRVELARRIVEYRYTAFQDTWTEAVQDMVERGIPKPVEAMAPTGGWRRPLAIKDSNPRQFIIDGANADIDATFFGKSDHIEDFVEATAVRWAEKTTGKRLLTATGKPDYKAVNRVLKQSEVTPFPRNPEGSMSARFRKDFPEIVQESYPGAYGQRSLEVTYLTKAKADIVRYDGQGNLVARNGKAQLIEDQPAMNVVEDLTRARYTKFDRMQKLAADFNLKYKGHLTGNLADDSENTAKMLQRMIEEDSHLRGLRPEHHPLYGKALTVKGALREGDDAMMGRALDGQTLEDFVREADDEMLRIHTHNQQRIAYMMDDSVGTASRLGPDGARNAGRLNTALKALSILGYGATGADAYLKAKKGEESKEVAKALAAALAGDVVGTGVGSAVGTYVASTGAGGLAAGTAGVVTGIGAGVLAGVIVNGGVEMAEDQMEDVLSGYKVDASVEKMFPGPGRRERLLTMSADEIEAHINSEWEKQHQWGGLYQGRYGNEADQEELRREILEKVLKEQVRLRLDLLRTEVVADIMADELAGLVRAYESGQLSGEELEAWKERCLKEEGFDQRVAERLQSDYRNYSLLFYELERRSERDGLWQLALGEANAREASRAKAIDRYEGLLSNQEYLEGALQDFDLHFSSLRDNTIGGADPRVLRGLFERLEGDLREILDAFQMIENAAPICLTDINLSYGKEDDLTAWYTKKSHIALLLRDLRQEVDARRQQFKALNDFVASVKKYAATTGAPDALFQTATATPESGDPEKVTVPSVIGQTSAAAIQAILDKNLRIATTGLPVEAGEAAGFVRTQSPAPGRRVPPGTTVTIQVTEQRIPAAAPPAAFVQATPAARTTEPEPEIEFVGDRSMPVGDLQISPSSSTIQVGQFSKFLATPIDVYGNPVTGNALAALQFRWMVNDASVANVSGSHRTGLISSLKEGTVQVICQAGGAVGIATVTVKGVAAGFKEQSDPAGPGWDRKQLEEHYANEDPGFGQRSSGASSGIVQKTLSPEERARQDAEWNAWWAAEQQRQAQAAREGQQMMDRALQDFHNTMNSLSTGGRQPPSAGTPPPPPYMQTNPYKAYEPWMKSGQKKKEGQQPASTPPPTSGSSNECPNGIYIMGVCADD